MATLTYKALDSSVKEIRLLKLEPASDEVGPIRGEISIHPLDTCPSYIALSYVWGNPHDTEDIYIDGYKLPARRNLVSFLFMYRVDLYEFLWDTGAGQLSDYIWIDAICIDQSSSAERSSQVGIMGEIYKRAGCTICWLGAEANKSDFAISILNDLNKRIGSANAQQRELKAAELHPDLRRSKQANKYEGPWKAIYLLLERPYWKRVWTFQEMALPNTAVVFCGTSFCDLQSIFDVAKWLVGVAQVSKPSNFDIVTWAFLVIYLRTYVALVIRAPFFTAQMLSNQNSPYDKGTIKSRDDILAVASMIFKLQDLNAQDGRDRIYGLLGVFPLPIRPDYGKSADEVFLEFASLIVKNGGADMVLLRACHSNRSHNCESPGWVPRWDQENRIKTPFLSTYQEGSCTQGLIDARIGTLGTLILSGVKVYKIRSTWLLRHMEQFYECTRGLLEQWQPNAPYISGGTNLEAMLRTLLRNSDYRDQTGSLPEQPYSVEQEDGLLSLFLKILDMFLYFGYHNRTASPSAFNSRLITLGLPTGKGFASQLARLTGLSDRCVETIQNLSALEVHETMASKSHPNMALHMTPVLDTNLFVTDSGLFGIGTRDTKSGDLVVVTEQCRRPLVLRYGSESYSFVCVAYVHGHMAQEKLLDTTIAREEFAIF